MGSGVAVTRQPLELKFEGSNPSSPAKLENKLAIDRESLILVRIQARELCAGEKMEFFEVLKKRHCVRSFDPDKPVNDEDLEKIIDSGRCAPSAGGLYPVDFKVIRDQKTKNELVECTRKIVAVRLMDFVGQAPAVIVIYANVEKTAARYGDRGRDFYVVCDAAAAAENIFLAAVALGLGACWVGAFDEEKVRKVLNLRANQRPMVIMPIGYEK